MENRIKRIEISNHMMADFLKDSPAYTTDLPEDASFVRIFDHEERDSQWMVLWSSEFEPVPEGARIPKLEVTVHENRA